MPKIGFTKKKKLTSQNIIFQHIKYIKMKNQTKKEWTTPSITKHLRESIEILGFKGSAGPEGVSSGSH